MTNDKVPAACQPELGEISRKPLRNINMCASLPTKGVLSLWALWPSRVSGKSGEGKLRTDVCTCTSIAAFTSYDTLTRKHGRWKMTWLHSWVSDFQGLSDRCARGPTVNVTETMNLITNLNVWVSWGSLLNRTDGERHFWKLPRSKERLIAVEDLKWSKNKQPEQLEHGWAPLERGHWPPAPLLLLALGHRGGGSLLSPFCLGDRSVEGFRSLSQGVV